MSDTLGAAAPVEVTSTPDAVSTPNPVSTEAEGHPAPDAKPEGKPDKAEAKADTKPLTARQALEKAAAKVEKDNAEPKPEVKTDPKTKPDPKAEAKPKDDKPRGEHGHFAPKDAKPDAEQAKPVTEAKPSYTAGDPPARFTKDVKDVWATLPDNVRGEVSRMERELTQGYEKHKQSAEAYEGYRELDDIAKQSGVKGHEVFRAYYETEQHLRRDLVGGLDAICQRLGVSFRDVAAHVMGQKPEQVSSQQDTTIRELKQEIAGLKQQVGSVSTTFQQQQASSVGEKVAAFASDPAHPRFEELHGDIAFFLKTKCPGDLKQAYELAERLNPAPAKAAEKTEASSAPVIDLSAQTEKGQKSINGAPSPGSTPAARKPSNSIKESLKRAMAQAG